MKQSSGFTLVELMVVVGAMSGVVMVSMLIMQKKAYYTKKLAGELTPAAVTVNKIKNNLNNTYKLEKIGNQWRIHTNFLKEEQIETRILSYTNKEVKKNDPDWKDLPLEYRKGRDSYQWVERTNHSSGHELPFWDLKEFEICWPAEMDCTHLNFNQPSTGSASRLLIKAIPHTGAVIESIIYLGNYLDGENPRESIKVVR